MSSYTYARRGRESIKYFQYYLYGTENSAPPSIEERALKFCP